MTALVLSRPRLDQVVIGVFLAALVVRVAFVLIQTRFVVFDLPFVAGDSILYLELARNISAGDGMRTALGPTAYVGPAYPLFLALLTSLGLDVLGIGLVQAIVGALAAALVALCAAELAAASGRPDRAALHAGIAGGATAVFPHIVAWTGYVLTETLFLALAAAAVFFALRAARSAALPLAAAAGLVAGIAALTRSAYLAAALVTLAWLAWSARTRRLQLVTLFAISLAVPMVAWTVRNVADLGAPVVTSTSGGGSMYHGNARGGTGGTRGYADTVDIPELVPPSGLDEVGRDQFYMRAALADISSDPLGTIAKWPSKLWNMWRPAYEGASLRNGVITIATYVPAVVLGAIGSVWLFRQSRSSALPLLLLLVWIASHVVIIGIIRYRVAGELFLLMTVPAGVALARAAFARARIHA